MERGDEYRIAWYAKEIEQVEDARRLPGWKQFHRACGKIDVYFDNYTIVRGRTTVRVFTVRSNNRLPFVNDLVYLARGEGHDVVSASIDGLRRSGGSSLEAWLAALTLQIEQLTQ